MESVATAPSIILISLSFKRFLMFGGLGIKDVLCGALCGITFFELCENVSIAKIDAGRRSHCLTERWRRRLQDLFGGQTASDQCERQDREHAERKDSGEMAHFGLRLGHILRIGHGPTGFQVSGEPSYLPCHSGP